jgi:hypothetical protein
MELLQKEDVMRATSLRRRTSIVAFFAAVLLAATIPTAAQADPPTRTTEPPFDFETSLFCGFPLRSETLQNNVKITTFSDGRQLVTGRRTVRLTNLSTGESLVLTDAGRLTTDPQQTVDTFSGRLVFPVFPGEPGGPRVWLFVGKVVATFAEPGGFFYSTIDVTGSSVDLCAALRD